MADTLEYDVAIIGGGSAGYAAARSVAAGGKKAVVIEGGNEVGGLCILRGCMPTKALLYASEVMHLTRHAPTWGIHPGDVQFRFDEVMARKNVLIQEFADYRRQQLANGAFDFIRAQARFLDPHLLALSDGRHVRAPHIVIATGSEVAQPPLPQLKSIPYLTSDEALTLKKPPRSLIILGGGAVAVEFAQFFARFGVPITLVQRSAHLLREFDADAAHVLEEVFRREGIRLWAGTHLLDAWHNAQGMGVAFKHEDTVQRVEAEQILFALGRTPSVASLDLAKAQVRTDGNRIMTDAQMRTSAPGIYAAGDCCGKHEIVHIAIQQAEVAAHNIVHPDRPRLMDDRLLTTVIFTEPQVAVVGLTEKEATARSQPYITAKYSFADHGKSLIMEAKDGFVKLLADPKTGEILGGACVGPVGGELIHEIVVAMANRMTAAQLVATPHYHPTLAEIWTYPAEDLAAMVKE
jgi:pyruvate/2-oxoglutarate dehydrogenase complex dihydrolipoamide dehydrogenase (E3) component